MNPFTTQQPLRYVPLIILTLLLANSCKQEETQASPEGVQKEEPIFHPEDLEDETLFQTSSADDLRTRCLVEGEPFACLDFQTRRSTLGSTHERLKASELGCKGDLTLMCGDALAIEAILDDRYPDSDYDSFYFDPAFRELRPECVERLPPEQLNPTMQFLLTEQKTCEDHSIYGFGRYQRVCRLDLHGLDDFISLHRGAMQEHLAGLRSACMSYDTDACQQLSNAIYATILPRVRAGEDFGDVDPTTAGLLISSCLLSAERLAPCALLAEIAFRNYACLLAKQAWHNVMYKRANAFAQHGGKRREKFGITFKEVDGPLSW